MTLAGNPYHQSHPTAIIDRTNEARAEPGNEANSDPPADPTLTNLPPAPVAPNRRHPNRSSLPSPVPDPFPTTGFTAIRPRPEGLSGLPSDLAPLAAPAPEAIASHFSQPSASFSLTPRLNSRKRPASLMMDLDKPGRPSQIAPDREIQMNRPNHRIPRQPVHPLRHDDELSTAQRLCDVTLDSPSSPGGGYKRMRSSADSDAGSSSCKDMDDPEIMAPDSVPALVMQLRQLLDYIASKPSLQHGSASFVRDYLRTMVLSNSYAAEKAIQEANKEHKLEVYAGRRKPSECFKFIPDELAKHIFGFLEGKHLARAREVCHRWNDFACEEPLWKSLCLKKWKALESDKDLWKLVDKEVDPEGPNCWRKIFPKVSNTSQWRCRLQKTGRFICNLVAHQISGTPLLGGLPEVLVVERRFNILHLQTFVRPDASILYFEPEFPSDRTGFDDFIDYLNKRTRAGLALEGQLRFIFIPPCDYTRTQVEYPGQSLLGVVQHAYPLVPEL